MTSSRHHHHHHHHQQDQGQGTSPWQETLQDKCRACGWAAPDFLIVSDRRGGRTAWSCVVKVYGTDIKARFWYDGRNLNNAKEDAAEAALIWIEQSGW